MGQAWCKERATKVQDSKSPLDRVFVRCAHQIYPTLKEDGSVLGGATQRVTSSEIGYAGSPPREILTRGQSLDSVDRPFHPSEWVDVILEVPSTPSSVITNLTANTSFYPTPTTPTTTMTTTLSSTVSESNSNYVAPIPPPRHRKKNRGRPLPPKPDEILGTRDSDETSSSATKGEPLYSSVKPKNKAGDESWKGRFDETTSKIDDIAVKNETTFLNESKVNGTGRIIPSIRTEKDEETNHPRDEEERKGHHPRRDHASETEGENKASIDVDVANIVGEVKNSKEDVAYERLFKNEEIRGASTPRGAKGNSERETSVADQLREYVTGTRTDDILLGVPSNRPKNYSTISLPNYDELEVVKSEVEREDEATKIVGDEELVAPKKPGRARNISTTSLPSETINQKSTERLAEYVSRCRSFGSLRQEEIIEKLKNQSEEQQDGGSSDEEDWDGLDDWGIGEHEIAKNDGRSPVEPISRLKSRTGATSEFESSGKKEEGRDEEVTTSRREESRSLPRNSSFEIPKSPNVLKSAMKDDARRKISMPAKFASEEPVDSSLEDWFSAQERSVRFFDPPPPEEKYANAPGHRPGRPKIDIEPEVIYDPRSHSYNGMCPSPLNIDQFFGTASTFENTNGGSSDLRSEESASNNVKKVLTRSLSNESEPFDGYEEKELTMDIRSQSSIGLSKTISNESIPSEMVTDFFDQKSESNSMEAIATRDRNGSSTSPSDPSKAGGDSKTKTITPPPSPEPKIRAEIVEGETGFGSRGYKIPKDEEDESNLSSMTPSLTELEAALSDMMEKEEHEGRTEEDRVTVEPEMVPDSDHLIEPKIVPCTADKDEDSSKAKVNEESWKRNDVGTKISLDDILRDGNSYVREKITRRTKDLVEVGKESKSTNPFEDYRVEDEEEINGGKFGTRKTGSQSVNPFDEAPEKPSRLQKFITTDFEVPTPPQRRNKHHIVGDHTAKNSNNDSSEFPITNSSPHPNDRLI